MTYKPMHLAPLALAVALAAGAGPAPATDTRQDVEDARREAQIWTTYGFNPHLRAMDITVEVNSSTAILSGTVESGVEKDLAEQIALSVEGIAKVDNRLKVDSTYAPAKGRGPTTERDFSTAVEDATVTARIKSKLLWNQHTDGLQIDVDTKRGIVTLKGRADSEVEKDLAGRLALNTPGVASVSNLLAVGAPKSGTRHQDAEFAAAEVRQSAKEVGEKFSDAWITAKVKSTFAYSSNVRASTIDVDTRDGAVSLRGVATAAERDAAVALARDVRGVKSVDASGIRT